MMEGGNIENKKNTGCPVHKSFQGISERLERGGIKFVRVNLRSALEKSLNTHDNINSFLPEFVPGYSSLDEMERGKIEKYLLIADLLKRGLWSDIKNELLAYSVEDLEMDIQMYSHISMDKFKNEWEEKVDTLNTLVLNKMGLTLNKGISQLERGFTKDEIYQKRYRELSSVVKGFIEPDGMPSTVGTSIGSGVRTSVEFPMGMLKYIPKLLEAQGKPVTVSEIKRVFFKNLVKLSSTVAAQNLLTFSVFQNSLNQESVITQPSDFSSSHFMLDEQDNIVLNQDGVESIHNSRTEMDVFLSEFHGKIDMKEPHITCPALFSNIIIELNFRFVLHHCMIESMKAKKVFSLRQERKK